MIIFCKISIYLVLVHAEVGACVLNKHVVLPEAARIHEKINPLPRRKFTLQENTSSLDANIVRIISCIRR